jgi:DNA-binding transcriptional LysR family regulator
MIDLVQEAFDLGISPFPPPDATLVRRRLGTLSLMLCGAPTYIGCRKFNLDSAVETVAGRGFWQK